MSAPIISKSVDNKWINIFADKMAIRLEGKDTNGIMGAIEQTVIPGGGIPPHVHQREDECFFITEGKVDFIVDGKTTTASKGDIAFLPKNIPHGYSNPYKEPAMFVVTFYPAGFETFFKKVDELNTKGQGTPENIINLCAKEYDIHFVS